MGPLKLGPFKCFTKIGSSPALAPEAAAPKPELLRSNLSRVQIPEPTHSIYKHECFLSFDTPRSEGGLFVDMNSFLAFGKDYVTWNFEIDFKVPTNMILPKSKTGNPVYLHIKQQTTKSVPEDRPLKKPTLLAIGVDGGFDNNEPEYEESYSIVILPDFVSLSVELPEKVGIAVDTVVNAVGAERKEQVAAWTAEKKTINFLFGQTLQLMNDAHHLFD